MLSLEMIIGRQPGGHAGPYDHSRTLNVEVLMSDTEFWARAQSLPTMNPQPVGELLHRYASHCDQGAIVEIGAWLGFGTAHLALGSLKSGAPLHVYDGFQVRGLEREKAKKYGLYLCDGEDTLPLVKKALEPFGANITFHKGDIRTAEYSNGPIGLYVDDAAKQQKLFEPMMRTFGAHFSDGTILVLLDFWYFNTSGSKEHQYQHDFMRRWSDVFEPIPVGDGMGSAAIFRYHSYLRSNFQRRLRQRKPLLK